MAQRLPTCSATIIELAPWSFVSVLWCPHIRGSVAVVFVLAIKFLMNLLRWYCMIPAWKNRDRRRKISNLSWQKRRFWRIFYLAWFVSISFLWSHGATMQPRLFPPQAKLYCEKCDKYSRFLSIQYVVHATGVSRSTVYYWMEHAWVHWIELPGGHRRICEESLHRKPEKLAKLPPRKNIFSNSVRLRPTV